ncbi:MAG: 3-hydroxybutyryl-CoA epimerase [Saprospirales bacterium]|nr:3-hydroxybutyryl-CoA epimerase [Saprospirales bacterium]
MITYTKDTDLIATLTLDMKGRDANILNHEIVEAFVPVLEHLKKEKEKGKLRGVIITSAKSSFLAGGDIEYLYKAANPEAVFGYTQKLKGFFRDLERPGVPVVAAINGNAIGTGFELALACHHRIVVNRPEIQLGLPEIHFGIMPGNGGVIRLMWLLGIKKAYDYLIRGERMNPEKALEHQLIDDLAADEHELLYKAKKWLLKVREASRPWDREGCSIPGGTAKDPQMARNIAKTAAALSARWKNNFPAPQAILNTLYEGSRVDFDTACRIESRYYAKLLTSPECKNMIKALWFDLNAIHNGLKRPKGFGRFRPRKVGIIGAGTMGSAIAAVCVSNKISVVLKDVSKMIAEQGRERVAGILRNMEDQNFDEKQLTAFMKKIETTENSEDFSDCDLVIESVFENQTVKTKVTREAEQHLDDLAFIGSNTLSIPITKLSKEVTHPEKFVGLHFLKPAEKKRLVEVVKGASTSDETIAKAFDFVRAIGKTPIVVNDSWGFYASRVLNTYILEGITMLQEGVPASVIENLGRKAGMPIGPLQWADERSLELVWRYEKQAAEHYGKKYVEHPAVSVLKTMIQELSRKGKASGKGFYDWSGKEVKIWNGLDEHFPNDPAAQPYQQIIERLQFAQIIEAVWCIQEKVINSVEEANIGSIFGWGFPDFKGGVIQYISSYGINKFLDKCAELEAVHGQRFSAPSWLRKKWTATTN